MILEVKKMQKKYGRNELPNDLGRTSEFEEVVLIEETEQDAKGEIQTGFEDFLYEAWKEKQFEAMCRNKEQPVSSIKRKK